METMTKTEKFVEIRNVERLVAQYAYDKENGIDPESRVVALENWKSEKRNLYRLVDGLSHCEMVEYGVWRRDN